MLTKVLGILLLTAGANVKADNSACNQLDGEVQSLFPERSKVKLKSMDATKFGRALKIFADIEARQTQAATAIEIPGPFADRFLTQQKVLESECNEVRLKLGKILVKGDGLNPEQLSTARKRVNESLLSHKPLSLLDLLVSLVLARHLHPDPDVQKMRTDIKGEQIRFDNKYGSVFSEFQKMYPVSSKPDPKNLTLFPGVKALEESWGEEQRLCQSYYARMQSLLRGRKISPNEEIRKSLSK